MAELETVFKIGIEGGEVTVFRTPLDDGGYVFQIEGVTMDLDENDDECWRSWSRTADSMQEALSTIAADGSWILFYPSVVHADYQATRLGTGCRHRKPIATGAPRDVGTSKPRLASRLHEPHLTQTHVSNLPIFWRMNLIFARRKYLLVSMGQAPLIVVRGVWPVAGLSPVGLKLSSLGYR